MTKKTTIEERLIASARQALAIKRGEIAPAKAYDLPLTARDASAESAPDYSGGDIARIRTSLGLSQALFAEALNVSLGTVRSWEQGIRYPDGAASRLLQVAERDPSALTMYVRSRNEKTGHTHPRDNTIKGGGVGIVKKGPSAHVVAHGFVNKKDGSTLTNRGMAAGKFVNPNVSQKNERDTSSSVHRRSPRRK